MKRSNLLRGLALLLALLLPAVALAEPVEPEPAEDAALATEAVQGLTGPLDALADPEAAEMEGVDLFDVDLLELLPEAEVAGEAPLTDMVTPPAEDLAIVVEEIPEEIPDEIPEAPETTPADVPEAPAAEAAGTDADPASQQDALTVDPEAAPRPAEAAQADGEAEVDEEAQPDEAEATEADLLDPEELARRQAEAEAAAGEEPEAPADEEPNVEPDDEPELDGALEDADPQIAMSAGEVGVFPASLKLGVGERFTLDAAGQLSGQIAYASTNEKVAAVNQYTGEVVARGKGAAKIVAVNADRQSVSCAVTVLAAPAKVALSAKTLVMCNDAAAKLTVKLPKGTASRIAFTSGNEAVATVDAAGRVTAVAAGSAVITAATFNGKRASCKVTVLNGATPKTLGLSKTKLYMGQKEKVTLKAILAEGCAAKLTWSSSNRKIAVVNANGTVKAKKRGKVKITVRTHNGLKKSCWIKVVKAPKKVALSAKKLTLVVGASKALKTKVNKGTASQIRWSSSAPAVATVSASGVVTAVAPGKAKIVARTYNGKKAACVVTVKAAPVVSDASTARMAANIRAATSVGAKRDALAGIVELLVSQGGYEPAFAAGVAANVWCEGSYGFFESSRYVTYPKNRPRYFCYLDGGNYYKNGVLTAVYMSKADYDKYRKSNDKVKERFASANFYLNNYSGKYAWNVNLTGLEAVLAKLEAGGWVGKFGLGVTQWTGERTKGLVQMYRKHAGSGNTITQSQVIAAENEMIMNELRTSYAFVYNNWKREGNLTGASAAASAADIFCRKYEVPANVNTAASTRAAKARTLYNIMMG